MSTKLCRRQAVLQVTMGVCQPTCEVTGWLLAACSPGAGKPGRVNTRSWFHRAAERDETHTYWKTYIKEHGREMMHVDMHMHDCRELHKEVQKGTQIVIRQMDSWTSMKYRASETS